MGSEESTGLKRHFAVAFLALIALALTANADTGAYNYNLSIANPNSNYSIGTDMKINAFVSYLNLSVREYPCILTFYDYVDNNTLFSERIYTDELGQLLYIAKVGDMFTNNQNYTYALQCSNTTATGKILITVNTRHTFIDNLLEWMKQNIQYMLIVGAVSFLALIVLFAKTHK